MRGRQRRLRRQLSNRRTSFISDGRPQPKELTEALARHSNLRKWLSSTECLDGNQNEVQQRQDTDQSSPEVTNIKARHKRGRRARRKKKQQTELKALDLHDPRSRDRE